MNQKIVGYITSNHLRDGYFPHQFQNLLIKNFVESNNAIFLLSWTGYKDRPTLAFDSLLLENFYSGICFYSMEQILQFPDPLNYLYALKSRKIWVGFAKESLFFHNDIGFKAVLKILWLMSCVSQDDPPEILENL